MDCGSRLVLFERAHVALLNVDYLDTMFFLILLYHHICSESAWSGAEPHIQFVSNMLPKDLCAGLSVLGPYLADRLLSAVSCPYAAKRFSTFTISLPCWCCEPRETIN